jgi:hypothetical protein
MSKTTRTFHIRYPFLIYLSTVPTGIKLFFYTAFLSVLFVELIGKRFVAINHTFYVLGDIWLKLCYSLCAAIIFYFINQHFPKQKRKLKSIPFVSAKLAGIHFEVVLLIQTLSKDFTEQEFSKLTRDWVEKECLKVNPHLPLASSESATLFLNWFEYLNYKSKRIKALINDLLPLEDILEPGLMAIIYFIDQEVSGATSLNVDRRKIPNTNLSFYSNRIWHLVVDSEHAIRSRGKNHAKLERLHHHLFIKNTEAKRYFPEVVLKAE